MARFSLIFILVLYIITAVLAHPHSNHQLIRPKSLPDQDPSQKIGLRASHDPACPAGYLCGQESCATDVKCPDGMSCVSVEGTIACAPPGLQWCALNPVTFEAVGCAAGNLCCHGNCYVSNAVCCEGTFSICIVGTQCGVCAPGQACATNGSCLGGSNPVSTSSIPRTTSIPTVTVPPVSTTPTVVPSVDHFAKPGCYVDFSEARILSNGTSVDQSPSGMTVSKCMELADGWRFAGIEYKGECFWGDVLQNPTTSPVTQCDMACAGDGTQICGGGNRILIYEDTTWKNPSRSELADALTEYGAQALDFFLTVQDWRDMVAQYDLQQPTGKKRDLDLDIGYMGKRQIQITLAMISDKRLAVLVWRKTLRTTSKLIRTLIKTAANNRGVSVGEMAEYVELTSRVEAAGVEVESSIMTELSTPVARQNVKLRLELVLGGLGYGTATLSGFALFLSILIAELRPTCRDNCTPHTTIPSTPTQVTSTSSSSSVAPTGFIIIVYKTTTILEFNDMVKSFPTDPRNMDLSWPKVNLLMYVAYFTKQFAGTVARLPIVECMSLDVQADDDTLWNSGGAVTKRDLNLNNVTHIPVNESTIEERQFGYDYLIMQRNAPNHLQWLSRVDVKGMQDVYEFEDSYLYSRPYRNLPTGEVDIYILDTGINVNHQDFATSVDPDTYYIAKFLDKNNPVYPSGALTDIRDDSGHGTCMASIAGGRFAGSAKRATIIPVKVAIGRSSISITENAGGSIWSLADGLGFVINSITTRDQQGRSVVSLSSNWASEDHWPLEIPAPPGTDPIETLLDRLFEEVGAVMLSSAGNRADKDPIGYADSRTPGYLSVPDYPLIIVGAVDSANKRCPFSSIGTEPGVVSIYGYGAKQYCASHRVNNGYISGEGTSQATAQLAGLAATFFEKFQEHLPSTMKEVPLWMKTTMRDAGQTFKLDSPIGESPNGKAPLAHNDVFVRCEGENDPSAADIMLLDPASTGALISLTADQALREVYAGTIDQIVMETIDRVGFCPYPDSDSDPGSGSGSGSE